jgi:hypothetical protein
MHGGCGEKGRSGQNARKASLFGQSGSPAYDQLAGNAIKSCLGKTVRLLLEENAFPGTDMGQASS